MAIITVHHWADPAAGLAEMARVARRRVVVLSFDPPALLSCGWCANTSRGRSRSTQSDAPDRAAGGDAARDAAVEEVPVPRLCEDGFFCALWDRPEMHLDPRCAAPARSGT